MKLRWLMLLIPLCAVILASCTAEATFPLEPTLTPIPPTATPIQPTRTPTPSMVQVTEAEAIFGTWYGFGYDGMYQQFNPDGTCKAATHLENLGSTPNVECTYHFEAGHLIHTTVSVSGVPPCNDAVSIYDVFFTETGNMVLKRVKDTRTPRIRTFAQEHERVE